MTAIKDGDYVVFVNRYEIRAVPVIRVTEKLVYYRDPAWGGEARLRMDDVVFSGPKSLAERLATQLLSSDSRCSEEKAAAVERREERDRLLIEGAYASAKENAS